MTQLTFWGLTASPYQLKMQALADYSTLNWQRWPQQASRRQAFGALRRLNKAKKAGAVKRFPAFDPALDEYPSVPFYTLDTQQFYYDSSSLALHLDELGASNAPLLPEEAAANFLCRLIDETFDEFGLYMVHHNRWVTSAQTNVMGTMTATEMAPVAPGFVRKALARRLPKRQARRCAYLFSVSADDFDCGMPPELTPPALPGFPATHNLLDTAWRNYLQCLEDLLAQQPYLLGQRFTLADASAYGQLAMNLVDGEAARLMQELAPRTFEWLHFIQAGGHKGSAGDIAIGPALTPLLKLIDSTFCSLMQQNESAYCSAVERGQTLFNEAAFDAGEALYDGELLGAPFRAVIKTFQVSVWRDLQAQWQSLADDTRAALLQVAPELNQHLGDAAPA